MLSPSTLPDGWRLECAVAQMRQAVATSIFYWPASCAGQIPYCERAGHWPGFEELVVFTAE
ncbi:hypothetical protein PsYK624_148130 [Phanerochaete sordida]|uniref:Uncharacterized protein n=1 Tax=Phanerochaete sordida TaxID=48140 RepID=A0A9P3GSC2_9APHY|nr:hypothetical protein PsYK624_148130 [Phanerochaete sordida]